MRQVKHVASAVLRIHWLRTYPFVNGSARNVGHIMIGTRMQRKIFWQKQWRPRKGQLEIDQIPWGTREYTLVETV